MAGFFVYKIIYFHDIFIYSIVRGMYIDFALKQPKSSLSSYSLVYRGLLLVMNGDD